MKISIVIAILNSHEIVRRQLLHFKRMNLDDVEFVFVDDGSDPPLEFNGLDNMIIHRTHNYNPWTQPMARNKGVEIASGEYVICTDIDHIILPDAVNTVKEGKYDVVRFKRFVGVLDDDGIFTDDRHALSAFGYPFDRGKRISAHGNSYAIRRDLFLQFGGSQQKKSYPNRDEIPVKKGIKRLLKKGEITVIPDDDRPNIYMIPNGRFCGNRNYNPFGYFHDLKR